MSEIALGGWQEVQGEVLSRIQNSQWKPGDLIPNEVDLAEEFGCSRATVNRALQAIADLGFLDRRRKAGTRVALHPVRRATLKIPIIRQEIEGQGRAYAHKLFQCGKERPPQEIAAGMNLPPTCKLLHIRALHTADDAPYAYEDRWINQRAVPEVVHADFKKENANEWLVRNAPFTSGTIAFSACSASQAEAGALKVRTGDALFVMQRRTWNESAAVTIVRLCYPPGHKMETAL